MDATQKLDAANAAIPVPPARFGHALSMAGALASRLATLAVLILLPKQIGLTNYGMFALVITLGEIIEMTSSNWYRLLLVRQSVNVPALATDKKRGFTLFALIIFAGLSAILSSLLISPLIASHEQVEFSAAVACYIFAFILFRLLVSILQAQGRQSLIGIVELVRGALTFGLVIGAIHFGQATFAYASFGLIAATCLTALAGLPAIRNGLGPILLQRLEPGTFKAIGIPIIIATILTYQLGWLDRVVIQHWMGPQNVGLYVAVIAIARQPIDLVLNALNSQTFPILMTRSPATDSMASRRLTGVLISMCIMGFGATASIIALADPLVHFALPAFDYNTAIVLVPLIAFGSLALGIKHFVFDNIFHAHGQNWTMLRWFALISILTLGLTLALVPLYGPLGAAAAFVLGSMASLVSSAVLSRRFCRLHWPASGLLRITASAFLAGMAAYACVQFDAQAWLRLLTGISVFCLTYLAALMLILNFRPGVFLSSPWNIDGLRGTAF